jgi:hypothetical protein
VFGDLCQPSAGSGLIFWYLKMPLDGNPPSPRTRKNRLDNHLRQAQPRFYET